MALPALRADALSSTADGFRLRLALPWIRSLPLSSIHDLLVTIDDRPVEGLVVRRDERLLTPAQLTTETGWWFLQDRLVLEAPVSLDQGEHAVSMSFQLFIPYLNAGPAPLTVPFALQQDLVLDAAAPVPTVSRDVA